MSKRGFRRLLILFTGCCLLAMLAAGAVLLREQARDRALTENRAEGLRLTKSGEYAAGLELLSPYVARYRDDEEALLAYARCRLGLPLPNGKHVAGAINAARQAADTNPDRIAPLEFLIAVYADVKLQTELVAACERALALDPTLEVALDARVFGLLGLDRIEEARDAADVFVRTHPSSLRSALASAAVLEAEGGDAGAIDAYLRSDEIASRLADQVVYHLRVAGAAAAAGEEGDTDGFSRAASSARTAAEMPQRSALVAAETTSLLRRLAHRTGDESLRAFAEQTVDRRLAAGTLGDRYAALESWDAWWRLDDERARALMGGVTEPSDDIAASGWLAFLSDGSEDNRGVWSVPGDSVEESGIGDDPYRSELAFWASVVESSVLGASGGTPSEVIGALDEAGRVAPGLDVRNAGTYHTTLVSYIRGRALADSGQGESALSVLEEERALLRENGRRLPPRLLLSIADLCIARGEYRRATGIIESLELLGTGGEAFRAVINRYHDRVLGDTSSAMASREAAGQLERTATLAAEHPEDPGLAAMHAKLLLLAGRREAGLTEARRLLDLNGVPPDADLAELIRLIAVLDDPLAESLLGLAGDAWRASLDLTEARAQLVSRRSGPEAGLAVYDSVLEAPAAESVSAGDAMRIGVLRAEHAERFGLGDPVAGWRALSDAYSESAFVQSAVLESRAVRDDEPTARAAIARLRDAAGERSLEWRLASLRADLTFLPEDADARAERLSKTILELRDLQEQTPRNAIVRRLTAFAYDTAGDTGEAARALGNAARLDPLYYPEFVRYLLSVGNRVEAGRAMDAFAAIPAERMRPDSLRERAGLLQTLGRSPEAVSDRRILARSGRPEDLADLGLVLARLGNADEAAEVADLLIGPDRPDSAFSAGVSILIEAGRIDQAIDSYLAARGDRPLERMGLARLLIAAGAWDSAGSQLRDALTRSESMGAANRSRCVVMLVHTLLERGQPEEAGEVLGAWDGGEDRTIDALARGISRAAETRPDTEGAGDVAPYAALSRALATVRVARSESRSGTESSETASGLSAVGDALEAWLLGEIDLATLRTGLRSACDVGPARQSPLAWQTLLAAYETGEPEREGVLLDAAEVFSQAGWPLEILCESYIDRGRLEDAEKAVARLKDRLGSDTFRADVLLARIAAAEGRVETSLNWVLPHRDRLVAGEGTVLDRRVLVAGLVRTGRAVEAERLLEQVAENRPGEAGVLGLEAFASGGGATDAQRRAWLLLADAGLRAGTVDPVALGRSWAQLARESRRGEDASRALALLRDAGDSSSSDPIRIGMELASAEIVLGRMDAAEERYAGLVERYPASVILRNNYASLLAEDFGEPGRAVEQAREAMRLAKTQGVPPSALGVVGHTLGVAQRRAGELADAEATLRSTLVRMDAAGVLVPDVVIELCEILVERGSAGDARALVEKYDFRGRLSDKQRSRWAAIVASTE